MKKLLLALLLCLTACVFSGCIDEFAATDELMSPPTINDDQFGIYSVLGSDGKVPDFLYPARGDINTPVYIKDINGDGTNEAFAFSTDPDSGGSLITFMSKREGSWKVVAQFKNSAAQVDKVIIEDITGDKEPEIIVGWGSYRSMAATVCIYRREITEEGKKIKEYKLGYTYGDMMLTDFTDDGISELCTVTVHTTGGVNQAVMSNAIARVYTFAGETPYCAYAVNLSKNVGEYSKLCFGTADNGKKILVIDGLTTEGQLMTQILVLSADGSGIITPMIYSEVQSKYGNFSRPADMKLFARDIDGDGYLEMPFAKPMPGLSGDSGEEYMVYWMDYVGGSEQFETSGATLVNIKDGYYMEVEKNMENLVAVYHYDVGEYVLNLAKLDDEGGITELNTLFTIHKFDPEKTSVDKISRDYIVTDIMDDGSIIAFEYSKDYGEADWVKNIAESFAPLSNITY